MNLLQDAYEGMVQKVESLKLEKVLSHKRIARASLLTDALAGEKVSTDFRLSFNLNYFIQYTNMHTQHVSVAHYFHYDQIV